MKNLLIINAHPDPKSFNAALSEAYESGVDREKWNILKIELYNLKFNPILLYGYRQRTDLEPDLKDAIDKIQQSDHLVWFFPMWWYGVPALLKGFIDRVFLPGIAFEYQEDKPLPKKLFVNKTGHIFITADTPRWYDRFIMGSPAIKHFKKGVLQFCGINPVKVSYLAPLKNSSEISRIKWLERARMHGKKI